MGGKGDTCIDKRGNILMFHGYNISVSSCRGGKYTEEDAKDVLTQILDVVAFCHLQGVVHRDLKPEVKYIFKFVSD